MAKGYWIAHVDVTDPAAYEAYRAAVAVPLALHGGRFLIRGGRQEIREGQSRPRTVVVEFDSLDAALACYDSPEYCAARALRLPVATADFVIVEGWDG